MSTTLTRAADRDRQVHIERPRRPQGHLLLLGMTSIVAALAIGLSYAGRTQAAGTTTWSPESAANLNTVTEAATLDRVLEKAFPSADDRRFAATNVLAYVLSLRKDGSQVPNVGAIMSATIPVVAIEHGPSPEYQARLQRAVEHADAKHAARPTRVSLLSPDDLAAIKPGLVVRTPAAFRHQVLWWAGIYFVVIWMVALLWWVRGGAGDYVFLGLAHLLTAIGFAIVVSRSDPLRDTMLFVRYTQGVIAGCVAFAAVSMLDFRKTVLSAFTYVPLAGALFLSILLLLFGSGPAGSNATVNLGPIQPVEAIRLLLGLFLAGYFARRWELLRQIRGRLVRDVRLPAWLHLPRFDYVLPVTVGVGAALLFFFLQRDLGPALFVSCVFLAIYAIARNGIGLTLAGLAVLVAGFYAGYVLNISSTLSARVNMWQSAWDNVARGGDQIAQAIWALSSGGIVGTGIGLGDTRFVPAGFTDLPLAAIGEELGFIGVLCVGGAFAILACRGFRIAVRAANDYAFFLATIVTLFLVFPVLLMAAGMLGVVPLTGVVTPFVSFGGSAMVANFAALAAFLSCTAVLVLLWYRGTSVLDLWLIVTVYAWALEITLQGLFLTDRFSLAWYVGRIYSLVAASVVLIVLLSEATGLYAHLARTTMRQRAAQNARQVAMELLQHRGQVALLVPGGDEDQQVGHPATVSLPVVPDAPSPTKELFSRRLEQLVNIDSPSDGTEQERVAEVIAGWLEPLGVSATWIEEPDCPARSLVLTLAGGGQAAVALLGHTDTVFPLGTVAERPFRRQGDRCYGPGVADMKGGLVLAVMAMERSARRPRPFRELRLLVCADEETRLRAPAIAEYGRDCAAALVFECARENGNLVSSRKGALWRTMHLTGLAAHAGADTARGRSAVSALAHEILRIEGLTEGRPDMTSVVTTVAGGTAANTLPGDARATLDIRSSAPGDLDHALVQLAAGGPYDGVTIEIIDRGTWPPMPRDERLTRAALEQARELGLTVGEELSGGVSDGCWTGADGVPTLDGLGPVGALDHTEAEWIELETVERRVELAARLIEL